VNIISHAVKAPVAMLGLSNGARSSLTGFVAGLARASAEHNVAARMSLALLACCRARRMPATAPARTS
jgi:hypothetical protein